MEQPTRWTLPVRSLCIDINFARAAQRPHIAKRAWVPNCSKREIMMHPRDNIRRKFPKGPLTSLEA